MFAEVSLATFPYVNPETSEIALCDAHYQYVLLTYIDVLLTSFHS